MRKVQVRRPSFPPVAKDGFTESAAGKVWQVLCGDAGHWRVGLYSPAFSQLEQIKELERHTCPEFFFLLSGRLVLVLETEPGKLQEVELPQGRGLLVTSPHNGYCPLGPRTGLALVVERDEFDTVYKPIQPR